MSLFNTVVEQFPEFDAFLDQPDWYRQEMDYSVARFLLDFAVDLLKGGRLSDVERLMSFVESTLLQDTMESRALYLDFVQPIADIDVPYGPMLLGMLGPGGRQCYDAQFTG